MVGAIFLTFALTDRELPRRRVEMEDATRAQVLLQEELLLVMDLLIHLSLWASCWRTLDLGRKLLIHESGTRSRLSSFHSSSPRTWRPCLSRRSPTPHYADAAGLLDRIGQGQGQTHRQSLPAVCPDDELINNLQNQFAAHSKVYTFN